jgi:hypothetical protein
MTTDCVDTTGEVAAIKVVDEAAAAIVMEGGMVAAVLLLDRVTTAPPDGAAADNVAVQVLDTPPITLAGAHWIDERLTAEEVANVKVAVCDRPLYVAMMLAGRVEITDSVLAVKTAEEDPACTVIDVGIAIASLIVERPTTTPPAGAALDNATVHTAGFPPVTVVGEH